MNLVEILKFTEEYLKKYSFSKPRLEAEKLVSYVLNLDRIALYIHYERELSEEEKNLIKHYLKKMVEENKTFDDLKGEKKDFKAENLDIFNKSVDYLKKNGVPSPLLDTEYIFSDVLKVSRNTLKYSMSREIKEENKDKIREMLVLRAKKRKPLQYILGEWEFYGLPFKVSEGVLIPRADTEILVEQCIQLMREVEEPNILDIGSGTGAISIAIANELKSSSVTGIDINEKAIELANENKTLNKIENVNFIKSDLFEKIDKDFKYDLIVSNPPYISKNEYETLMPEVKNYEPQNALTDLGDGLYFYREISKLAGEHLKDTAYLAYEIGYNQAKDVTKILQNNNFDILSVIKDYGGNDRVVIAKKTIKTENFEEIEEEEDVNLSE
ncbi:protein-(glutamine-N5) methyltransferase, release factor-specific [Fusobacterium vincentii 4_1_13]|uniref:Release factor glutamine methyltransferase n=2 Tax=Fusobacterium vincentii TaxID=155615 RepID=A0ABV3Y894_FUSVC|nr:peptide chain release factor N(5)-glutamine methyltransferase [Fusobacterium vincentii]EEO40184.2 protein-(glutamine-N5) methyltransferase, release factor-specific [Fusobacterium vincentii 4_1_13]